MSALGEVAGTERIGLIWYHRHLLYGVHDGWGRWLPMWLKSAIVSTVNPVCCLLIGHDTFGPLYEPPDEEGRTIRIKGITPGWYPQTCTACSKRWPDPGTCVHLRVWTLDDHGKKSWRCELCGLSESGARRQKAGRG